MFSLQCGTPCAQAVRKHSAFKGKQTRPLKVAARSQVSPVPAAKHAWDAAASFAASLSAAALLLALPANAAAPTLFDNNTSYSQELQDLVEKRGGLGNFSPQEAVKKAADKVSGKASDAADSAKFTLNKDLPISKGTIDTPDALQQALPEAAKNLPSAPAPPADVPKPETPSLPTPKLEAPKLEAPKLEAPSLPKPPKVEAPSLPTPSVPTPSTPDLPQQAGGGLPTPYLAAGGVAVLAILGIGLAGAKPDDASPAPSATSKSSGGGGSSSSSQSKSSSSGGGLPDGKDPELDSEVAKKKDPFFKEVDKRTN